MLERAAVEGKVFQIAAVEAARGALTSRPALLSSLMRKELIRPERPGLGAVAPTASATC